MLGERETGFKNTKFLVTFRPYFGCCLWKSCWRI